MSFIRRLVIIKDNDILLYLWLMEFYQLKGKLIALLLKNNAKVDISYS